MSENKNPSRRYLIETLFVLSITVIGSLAFPILKGPLAFLPLLYLFVEMRVRRRSFAEIGFNFREIPAGLKQNSLLIFLVAGVIQVGTVWISNAVFPQYLAHVQARIPLFSEIGLAAFILPMALGTLAEEISYRGLFQARLSWFIGTFPAILGVSVLFGLMHYAPGDMLILFVDIFMIIVDSILYGLIFSRSKNIWVAWLAHFTADLVALTAIVLTMPRP